MNQPYPFFELRVNEIILRRLNRKQYYQVAHWLRYVRREIMRYADQLNADVQAPDWTFTDGRQPLKARPVVRVWPR